MSIVSGVHGYYGRQRQRWRRRQRAGARLLCFVAHCRDGLSRVFFRNTLSWHGFVVHSNDVPACIVVKGTVHHSYVVIEDDERALSRFAERE
jgi:hypothetical protein